jgi:hypothetical protein
LVSKPGSQIRFMEIGPENQVPRRAGVPNR